MHEARKYASSSRKCFMRKLIYEIAPQDRVAARRFDNFLQVLILSSTWTGLCLLPHLRKRNAELQSRRSLILNNEPLGLRCFEQKESSETHFLLYFLDEANGVLLWQKTIRRMFSLPARSTFPAIASYQKELQQTRIELILSKTYHTSLTHPFTVLLESPEAKK
jgi:hypothetical protein